MPLIIRLALQSDTDDILDFLRKDFYPDEPLRQSIEPHLQPEEDEEFLMANIQYGICLVAEDNVKVQDDFYSSQIIGAVIAGPKYSGETKHLLELANIVQSAKWSKILKLYAYLETTSNLYQTPNNVKAAHCHAIAVSPKFRGRSIGNKMLQKYMEIACKHDYNTLTFDCTSLYAIRICENLNMECLHTLAYTDYHDENGRQVFFPQEPHKYIKIFLQRV